FDIVAVVLVLTGGAILALRLTGRMTGKPYTELFVRWRSWVLLSLILIAPVLAGVAWVMAAVCLLSLLCYREFARATGLFREKAISVAVVLGILLVTFAVVDNFARLFFASAALTVAVIAIISILRDQPKGYIQ